MEIKMSFFSHPSSQTPRIVPRGPMDFRSRPLLLGEGANGSYNRTTITEEHNPIETTPVLGVLRWGRMDVQIRSLFLEGSLDVCSKNLKNVQLL